MTTPLSGNRPKRKTGKYDLSVKEMLAHNFLALLHWLVPEVAAARLLKLPVELPATARQVDLLVRVRFKPPCPGQRRPPDKILIIEFQAQRDPKLHRRMLLRAALAHALYGCPVQTIVLTLTAEVVPLIPAMKPADGDHAALLRRVVKRILSWALPDDQRTMRLEQAAHFATLRLPRPRVDGIVRDVTRRHRIMLDPLRDFPLVRDGYRKGKVEGKAESVILILEARGMRLTRTLRDKILSCTDPTVLNRWLRSAVSASSAADVVGAT